MKRSSAEDTLLVLDDVVLPGVSGLQASACYASWSRALPCRSPLSCSEDCLGQTVPQQHKDPANRHMLFYL